MKRTPAHVGRLQPTDEKNCLSRLIDTEYLYGLLGGMDDVHIAGPLGSGVTTRGAGVDGAVIRDLWEQVGQLNFGCVFFKETGVTIGQEYENYLGSLSRKYGTLQVVPIEIDEMNRLGALQGDYVDAFLNDILQIDR